MGNKYVKFFIFALLLVAIGVVYQKYFRPADVGPAQWNGNVVEVTMTSLKDQWKFDPENIEVQKGDKVIIHVYNQDAYDHGFAIESFGVNTRLFASSTTTLEFIAANTGEYPFYCSVACGTGHSTHVGKVIVR